MRTPSYLALLCGSCLLAQPLRAATYGETGSGFNSHSLPASAEAVPYDPGSPAVALQTLSGAVTYNADTQLSEGDVFKIYISDPAAFSAGTPVGAPNVNGFDTQLFLFDLNGHGIESNDNDPANPGGSSALAAKSNPGFAAGYYYLAITGSSLYPAAGANGASIFSDADPTVTYGPTDPSAMFTGYNGSSTEGGQYRIALTGVLTSVPEPSDFALALGGAASLAAILRAKSARRVRG